MDIQEIGVSWSPRRDPGQGKTPAGSPSLHSGSGGTEKNAGSQSSSKEGRGSRARRLGGGSSTLRPECWRDDRRRERQGKWLTGDDRRRRFVWCC